MEPSSRLPAPPEPVPPELAPSKPAESTQSAHGDEPTRRPVPRWLSWAGLLGLAAAILYAAPTDDMGLLLLVAAPLVLCVAAVQGRLRDLGFRAPPSWPILLGVGLAAGVLLQGLSLVVVEPLIWLLTGQSADVTAFAAIEGNPAAAASLLLVIWTLVAFGEEIVFRGYMISEMENLFGSSRAAQVFTVILSSTLFGLGHLYQGLAGVLITGLMGAVMATLFLLAGKNLWLLIFTHGVVDTVAVVALYVGAYDSLTHWGRSWWVG